MRPLSSFLSVVLIPLLTVSPIRAQLSAAPAASTDATLQLRVVENSPTKFLVEVTDSASAPVSGAAVAFRLPDAEPTGTFADGSHANVVYTDSNGRAVVSGIHWGQTSGSVTVRITAAKGAAHAGTIIEQAVAAGAVATPAVKTAPQPGTIQAPTAKVAMPESTTVVVARSGASAPVAAPPPQPTVSITSASPGEKPHSSKKWLIIAILAGGAGAGAAMAMRGKSSAAAPSAPSLSIGNPSISVGHP